MRKQAFKTICLAAAAGILIAGGTVERAMAYFTTYVTAKGGYAVELGFTRTEIEEEVEFGKKEVVLTNTGDQDCYVRLKALTGNMYKDSLLYSEPDGLENWTPQADGYYYYGDIVAPGASTTRLDVRFAFPEDEMPKDFNVIIIQESTLVLYDDDGNPYADWSVTADVTQSVYKGEGNDE